MSDSEKTVLLSIDDHVATLTLNRPKALNALNSQLMTDLGAALDAIVEAEDVRVVILTGAGKAFAAGADISEMVDFGEDEAWAFAARGQRVLARLEQLPQPVLAAVNGYALGGGCELAMSCDIIYASERARFGQPEVGLAVTPGFGGTQRLQRLVGTMKARELIFTGRIIKADEALRIGLVAQVFSPETLTEAVKEIASSIASQGPVALALAKAVILGGAHLPLDHANSLEAEAFGRCFGTEDQSEGMRAFLEKRDAKFSGT